MMIMMIIIIIIITTIIIIWWQWIYDDLLLNCASKACLELKFDNVTPYRVETIDKTRLKGGLMNAEEGGDHNGPLTSLIR